MSKKQKLDANLNFYRQTNNFLSRLNNFIARENRDYYRRRFGIGRAVALAYALEGADVSISYLNEEDAQETCRVVKDAKRRCLLIRGDIGDESHCQKIVEQAMNKFGQIDILVNNAIVELNSLSITHKDYFIQCKKDNRYKQIKEKGKFKNLPFSFVMFP